LSDLGDTFPKVEKKKQLNGVRSPCRWSPALPGLVKFNVDAAVSRGGDHGAVSAVCRDANGRFLGASTRTIKEISDPATLEAIASSEALVLADDLGVARFQLSSDCLEVIINMMKLKNLGRYSVILSEIQKQSSNFLEIIFKHESMDRNGEAHLLARNAIFHDFGRRAWLLEPPYSVPSFVQVE
jgi:hypothetical protein